MKKRKQQKQNPPPVPGTPQPPTTIILKDPLVVDVAYNNQVIPWGSVKVAAVIAKASEALFEDSYFKSNWPALAAAGIPRGAYHFYRWYIPSGAQARKFVATLNKYGGVKPNDILVLDEEEPGNMSITSMLDFIYNVEQLTQISHTKMFFYSWPWALNALNFSKLSSYQVEYVREINIWAAGYPNNPNLYADPVSAGYKVDSNKFGPVKLWQYAENMIVPFIPGGTDVNWIDPQFLSEWKP